MSAQVPIFNFTRGPHSYTLAGAEGGYVGTRDGTIVARGHDRYTVARALIVSGTPIKPRPSDA